MNEGSTIELPAPREVLGVQLHAISRALLCDWILARIASRTQGVVFYSNVHGVVLAQRDEHFRAAMNWADVVFCDGQGVRLGARLLGYRVPERFTPPDWIAELAQLCAERRYRWFMLGGLPGVAEAAAAQLTRRLPALEIHTHHGYFDPQSADNDHVCTLIAAARPDLLLIGMGMPQQELWVQANLQHLPVPVALSVGALFDYVAGTVRRGPPFLTDHGFEWLCRLWFEPRRLWRRYLVGNLVFAGLIGRELLLRCGRRQTRR